MAAKTPLRTCDVVNCVLNTILVDVYVEVIVGGRVTCFNEALHTLEINQNLFFNG